MSRRSRRINSTDVTVRLDSPIRAKAMSVINRADFRFGKPFRVELQTDRETLEELDQLIHLTLEALDAGVNHPGGMWQDPKNSFGVPE